ncbi:LAQU0S10e03620g1_1 [Lachancea quebecensis]|uniref:LAQU0S10e03620g1_1 n=1 Tax=Lachancea quebecensis TaxID=1654605 RepID=A0A0P1KUZ6_9SACH|nr:LAQU0S10e03620g1_1 [Lachancea quebecensis]
MSRERPRSLTPQGRGSQRKHGLKVQTLPLPPELKSYDSVRTTQELEEDGEPDEYQRNNQQSSFEKDEDFKFKRHKHRNNAGTASLGERLDSLHELQNARWVENFNSSANMDRRARNSQRENPSQESQPSIPALPAPSIPPSYMPYMYYYPFAPMVHPMSTSPARAANGEMPQYISSSQGYPNTSTQPFMPPMPQPNSQLMPPPPLYPNYPSYNYYNHVDEDVARKSQRRREKRSSLMAQRGRRLSLLSFQDNSQIISPHKDVPERDFYRHIANTSFGQDLQIRQLFSWCLIRCLRKWESNEHQLNKEEARPNGETYADPKKIALTIIKEFVEDLRRGKTDINWDAEDYTDSSTEDNTQFQEEDTELRELFDEDDDTDVHSRPRKRRRQPSIKIPNEKNVENAKNLKVLEKQISSLEEEIKTWFQELDETGHTSEWRSFKSQLNQLAAADVKPASPNPPLHDLEAELECRVESLRVTSHFLNSNSELLSLSTKRKVQKLTQCINSGVFSAFTNPQTNKHTTRNLLRGLSRSLTKEGSP